MPGRVIAGKPAIHGRSDAMRTLSYLGVAAAFALTFGSNFGTASAQQSPAEAPRINERAIGGVVTGAQGPEAGVWVIAETGGLPTKLAKIVVTDERGRYVIPELPSATYDVWVRGYALVDSPKVTSAPGKILDLKATPAPDAKAAAQYYPALYWYALLQVPPAGDFPGTGAKGNGMPETLKSQGQWLDIVETHACFPRHQLGNPPTPPVQPPLCE